MTQDITLYWSLQSQPSRAVKALLDIGKIEHKRVQIDIPKGQSRTPQYLKINPFGQIPFLDHKGTKVAESNAILVFLCETYKGKIPQTYYGKTIQQRAKTNQYLSWYQSSFRPPLFKIILIKVYGSMVNGIPFSEKQLEVAKRQMFAAIQNLDKLLKEPNRKFLCGDNPTIADLLVFFELLNLVYYNQSHEKFENVTKWFKNVYNIPQVKAITHEWYPTAQKIQEIMNMIQPNKAKM